ncbi:MAG TPA: type III-A CRISPR-associated protein Csm2 [Oscillatoriaceae cyanobacterium M33_DOE_052]|uniref:CRISPR system Cms protein Csm2 n=1 Tax=Planktothricoides sp. SpSt-374 TaxID=2282167 RepID=A0A7C3VKB4_9CYAN|nr:type III-A CRISPR-associated protein Csm2 [Oscillatoriaceae cyanobacterium M33_DOE_052]
MSNSPIKPNKSTQPSPTSRPESKQLDKPPAGEEGITERIVKRITGLTSLAAYDIRELVQDAEEFGPYLKQQRLETNQVRKFLDAVNRIKVILTQKDDSSNQKDDFSKIEAKVVLLKPKVVYAAARQKQAKPLSDVMCAAIDKVSTAEDFDRLVQLIEAIIAYHKAAGGK